METRDSRIQPAPRGGNRCGYNSGNLGPTTRILFNPPLGARGESVHLEFGALALGFLAVNLGPDPPAPEGGGDGEDLDDDEQDDQVEGNHGLVADLIEVQGRVVCVVLPFACPGHQRAGARVFGQVRVDGRCEDGGEHCNEEAGRG